LIFIQYEVDALIPLAENLLRQGHISESRKFLDKVVAANPANGMARLLLVDGFLTERKADSARATLESWENASPALALPISIRKANILSMEEKFSEARAALEPYLNQKEDNFPAWSETAIIQVREGHYDSAVATYTRMEAIKASAKGELLVMKAYLHLKAKNPARALEALKTVSIGNQSGALLTAQAATYLALGQEHKIVELEKDLSDSAKSQLQSFTSQLPRDPAFIGQWALITYFQMNRQAFPIFMAARDLYTRWPKSPLAISFWSNQLANARKYSLAATVLATLPAPELNHRISLMSLYMRAGMVAPARKLAEQLLAENPKQPGLNLFLANWHFLHNQKEKAIAYYKGELLVDTASKVSANNLAWEYGIVQKDMESAKPYLDHLRRDKTNDPRILDTIGWILATNGNAEAREYLEAAVLLVPDQPSFNFHLGWFLAQANEKEKARKHLQTALASSQTFDERAEAEKLIAEL
jgi:predicted Zn-dependent protease